MLVSSSKCEVLNSNVLPVPEIVGGVEGAGGGERGATGRRVREISRSDF